MWLFDVLYVIQLDAVYYMGFCDEIQSQVLIG